MVPGDHGSHKFNHHLYFDWPNEDANRRIRQEIKTSTMTNIINKIGYMLLVLLAACNVSKDIEKADPPVPAHFRNAIAGDQPTISGIQWKEFFGDPSLQNLVEKAIAKNYDMQL